MKLTNIGEVNDLIATVERCKGEVWLESVDGDKLSLTSSFSRYVAIGSLIKDKAEQLEQMARRLHFISEGLRHAAVCPAENHMQCPTFQSFLTAAIAGEYQPTKL